MKRLLPLLFLIQSFSVAVALADEQPVKLMGIVDALGKKLAVIDSRVAGTGPRGNIILGEGQRHGSVLIHKIDSADGTVSTVVAGKTNSLTLEGLDGFSSANKTERLDAPFIRLVSVDLDTAISLYADFKSRTVLQHPQLEHHTVSMECSPHNEAEAAAAFEKMFSEQHIATIPDGNKFVMVVPFAYTNSVTPHADAIDAANASIPALSVNFKSAPLQLVVQAYSDFLGKIIVNSNGVPGTPSVTFTQTTPLSKAELLYAMETQMTWRNIRLVPDVGGNLKYERIR